MSYRVAKVSGKGEKEEEAVVASLNSKLRSQDSRGLVRGKHCRGAGWVVLFVGGGEELIEWLQLPH